MSDFVAVPDGWRISRSLVTLHEWAEFVRKGAYFAAENWDPGALGVPDVDGDAILERSQYRWSHRWEAVRGVSWFEARAYCRSMGGRMPYFEEWQLLPPRELVQSQEPEWCEEWFHPTKTGPAAFLMGPPRRRTVRFAEPALSPGADRHRLCFRLALPAGDRRRGPRIFE